MQFIGVIIVLFLISSVYLVLVPSQTVCCFFFYPASRMGLSPSSVCLLSGAAVCTGTCVFLCGAEEEQLLPV